MQDSMVTKLQPIYSSHTLQASFIKAEVTACWNISYCWVPISVFVNVWLSSSRLF